MGFSNSSPSPFWFRYLSFLRKPSEALGAFSPHATNTISALYLRGDPYETSDAVFGVKQSLVVDLHPADEETARRYDVEPGTLTLKYDIVLVSEKEASDLRDERSRKALKALGRRMKLLHGLPVPDVD